MGIWLRRLREWETRRSESVVETAKATFALGGHVVVQLLLLLRLRVRGLHGDHAAVGLKGSLVVGGRGEIGKELFAWRADGVCGKGGYGVVGKGNRGFGFIEGDAENEGLVFDKGCDQGCWDVEGWCEDDADCERISK